MLFAISLLPACVESHVIYDRPMLAGLPGSETQRQVTGPRYQAYDPRTAVPDDKITVKNKDGSTTLISRTGRHLMVHIFNTLNDNKPDLFVDQILSQRTSDEYYQRGLNPKEAFTTLKKHQADVKKLFDQMPMGEYTPGLFVRNLAGGALRLEVDPSTPGAGNLTWTAMDMVQENGNWKLLWFVRPGS